MATAEVDGIRTSNKSIRLENEWEMFDDTENVDTVFDRQCQPCLTESLTVKSSKFCYDCNEYLCKDCVSAHRKLNCTREHQIVDNRDDINDLPKMTSVGRCFYHTDKQLDHFCEKHEEFCCFSCLNTKHRACMAKPINEVSSKLPAKNVFDVGKKTEKVIDNLQEVKAARSKYLDLLVIQMQDTVESINLDLKNIFEQFHKKHTEKVERKCVELQEKLEKDIETCVEVEESLKNYIQRLKSGDKIEQFVAIKQLLKQLDIVQTTADAMVNEVPEKSLEFKRTPLCSKVLNEPELLIDFSENMRLYKTTVEQDTVYKRELKESSQFRCTCLYRGLSDLIFTDSSSVSIYDTMREKTKQISLPENISSIAVEKDNFFIALQDQGRVVTLGENDEMKTVLKTVESCVGIIKASKMFYVTVVSNMAGQLREYTLGGSLNNVLKTNNNGKNIFSDGIGEVKICNQERKLYVVDTKAGVVIVSAVLFKILKIIPILDFPKGISLLDDTSLFVVLANGEVRQTTDEGETWNIVLKTKKTKKTKVKPKSRLVRDLRYRMKAYFNQRSTNYSICWDGNSTMYLLYTSQISLEIMRYPLESIHK